jgi:hypothetical protein
MVFLLRIQIKGVKSPPVWREIAVPATFTFERLHKVIQAAFGWSDSHLYLFSKEGYLSSPWIKVPDDMDEDDVVVFDARKTKIKDYVLMWQSFVYLYDFGDDWNHKIKLERVLDSRETHAALLGGKGACPPENCGGSPGYEHLKQVIKNPDSEEAQELLAWTDLNEDERFDPKAFDFEAAKKDVASN